MKRLREPEPRLTEWAWGLLCLLVFVAVFVALVAGGADVPR